MAKLIRAAALVLCVLMLLPSSLAMAAADDLNDIIDEDFGTPAPNEVMDELALSDDPSTENIDGIEDDQAAEPDASADPGVPTFSSIDPTQPIVKEASPDALTNAGNGPQQAADITRNCKYRLSEGKTSPMGDSKLSTYWSNKKAAKIQITIPANDTAGGLYLEWYKKPADLQIIEFGADDKELQSRDKTAYTGLVSVYPLLPETKKIQLVFNKRVGISTLRVFSQGALPTSVQNWAAPLEKSDLMVVAAHQDDEFLYFGGTIPYYNTVQGKAVQVVYMANCGRARYAEALNGLWAVGMRNSPDFIGLPDKYTKTLKDAKKVWKTDSVMEALVTRIRKYKPDVIVSHDLKGEYGHGAHMMTAEALKLAVVQAADDTKFKSSAEAYGVWQVKKLYLHLSAENPITMDWQQPSELLSDKTPSEAAKLGYAAHKSQHKSFTYEDGGKYDNSKFGLVFTTVGEDVDKNDFFENIVEDAAKLNPTGLAGTDGEEEPFDDDDSMPDDEFFVDDSDLGDANVPGFEDDETSFDDFDDLDGDNTADPERTAPIEPPTESGTTANTAGLLGTLIGVPVLLGGSAFGTMATQRYLKKKRRAARKAEKAQDQQSA